MPKSQTKEAISTTKRHRKATEKKAVGMSKPAFQRVARTAGVKRVPGNMYKEGERMLDQFFRITLDGAIAFAAVNRRKTLQIADIKNSLSMHGRDVYGSVRVPKRTSKRPEKEAPTE